MRRFALHVFGAEELAQIEAVAEWKGRQATWEITDELRRQLGRHRKKRPEHFPLDGEEMAADVGPAEAAEHHDALEALSRYISWLPDRLGYVLRERLAGTTAEALAADLGCTDRMIYQLQRQAVEAVAYYFRAL